jgi:hypothetical protein
MNGRQQLGMAIAAALGGLMWGYLRHRSDGRATAYALIQAGEWFLAFGGAKLMLNSAHQTLDSADGAAPDDFEIERIARTRQIVSERTGIEG